MAVDAAGNLYVGDALDYRVRKIDTTGVVTTIAGTGRQPIGGDPVDGNALESPLGGPASLSLDHDGNVFISDQNTYRVRKVSPAGTISTLAGTGQFSPDAEGDGGPATAATFGGMGPVAVGPTGDVFVYDYWVHRVRRIDSAGVIHAYAGNGTEEVDRPCGCGNGGPAVDASLNASGGIAIGPDGLLYLADSGSIRRVDADGIITSVYGDGLGGYSGDGGPAIAAGMDPTSIGFDGAGNLYFGDSNNSALRKIDPAGVITTVANLAGTVAGGADGSVFVGGSNPEVLRIGPERLVLTESRSLDRPKVDDKVIHTFTVKNLATTASTNVRITESWTAEESFVTASKPCKGQGRSVSCSLGTLASGASASVTVTVQGVQAGAGRHTATAASNEADPNGRTNTLVFPERVSAKTCGLVVTKNRKLPSDIGPCADNGLIVKGDNLTLDLGGKRVYGFPGISGPAGNQAGVFVKDRHGVTVTNGTVSGFDAGVAVVGGGSNTITGVVAEDNVGPDDVFFSRFGDGIFIEDSTANVVRGNTVRRNGIFDGIAIYGDNANDNVIENNLVEGNLGPSDAGPAGQGIIANGSTSATRATSISNTRIVGNIVRGNFSAGISNINHVNSLVADNTVDGNGFKNANGNGIGIQAGARWNRNTPMQTIVRNNGVHGNAIDGIQIRRNAGGNQILSNNAAGNGLLGGFDLRDLNTGCFTNTWSGNTWGAAGFAPACTSTGGSPAPAGVSLSSGAFVSPAASSPAATGDDQGDGDLPPTRRSR